MNIINFSYNFSGSNTPENTKFFYNSSCKFFEIKYKDSYKAFDIVLTNEDISNLLKLKENEECKTITKKLDDYAGSELINICNHNDCKDCPLQFITSGAEEDLCVINRGQKIWKLDDYHNFFDRFHLYSGREVTVKESDLKDDG